MASVPARVPDLAKPRNHATLASRIRARRCTRSRIIRAVMGCARIPSTSCAARSSSTQYRISLMPSSCRMRACLSGVALGCCRSKSSSCAGVMGSSVPWGSDIEVLR